MDEMNKAIMSAPASTSPRTSFRTLHHLSNYRRHVRHAACMSTHCSARTDDSRACACIMVLGVSGTEDVEDRPTKGGGYLYRIPVGFDIVNGSSQPHRMGNLCPSVQDHSTFLEMSAHIEYVLHCCIIAEEELTRRIDEQYRRISHATLMFAFRSASSTEANQEQLRHCGQAGAGILSQLSSPNVTEEDPRGKHYADCPKVLHIPFYSKSERRSFLKPFNGRVTDMMQYHISWA